MFHWNSLNGILFYILCRSDRRVKRRDISNVDEMWIAFLLLYKRKIIAYNFHPSTATFAIEYSLMVRECETEEHCCSRDRYCDFWEYCVKIWSRSILGMITITHHAVMTWILVISNTIIYVMYEIWVSGGNRTNILTKSGVKYY